MLTRELPSTNKTKLVKGFVSDRQKIAILAGVCIAIAALCFVLQFDLIGLIDPTLFGPCILASENACAPEWAASTFLWTLCALGIGAVAYLGSRWIKLKN